MVKRERHITATLTEAMSKFPHLRRYVNSIVKTMGMPDYYVELDKSLGKLDSPNIIYGVNDPMFIHIYKEKGKGISIMLSSQESRKRNRSYLIRF